MADDHTLTDAIDIVEWVFRGGVVFMTTLPNIAAWYVLQANDADWSTTTIEYVTHRNKIVNDAIEWLGSDDAIALAHQFFGRGGTMEQYREMARKLLVNDNDSDMSE